MRFIPIVLTISAGLAAGSAWSAPNVVLVVADDLGIGDIGPYGSHLIKTPHLDRMAAEGVLFTDFYASANICTPSRGGLLTGRYPVRLGLTRDVARPTNSVGIDPQEITVADVLRDAGYATACIGKWHLGHAPDQWPTANGFDYFYGLPYSNDMTPLALYRMEDAIEEPVDQTTLTERYTQEAIAFIEKHRAEPFFVYLPHTMPHVPLFVSESFEGKSDAGLYGDVVETIDWSMGQLFDALDRLGLAQNTLVIFTSDNGPWWEGSSGNYRNRKGSAWDGGMRVPMIARWPGTLPAGATTSGISMNIDIMPTLLSLAGLETPSGIPMDGANIIELLKGGNESPHEHLLLYDASTIAAVRSQDWKLVVQSFYRNYNAPIGSDAYYYYPGLLFDMRERADELYSYTREHPEIAAQHRAWIDDANLEE